MAMSFSFLANVTDSSGLPKLANQTGGLAISGLKSGNWSRCWWTFAVSHPFIFRVIFAIIQSEPLCAWNEPTPLGMEAVLALRQTAAA